MTKRIVGILIAVLMVMALIPMSVFAADATRSGEVVRPEKAVTGKEVAVSYDFETAPTDWTFIDDDGDGYNWDYQVDYSETPHMTAYEGEGLIFSASYDNDSGTALTPDNWAITPAIAVPADATTFSFWVAGQDASYAAEHYAVYAGTSAAIADMVEIMPESVATGTYTQKTIDITEYAGQTVYFAIRHFNVTDMFFLNIDLVEIANDPLPEPPAPVSDLVVGYYFESDEEIADFTIINNDSYNYTWERYESETQAYEGVGFMRVHYQTEANDWLIAPAFEVPLLNARVSFWAAAYASSYPETFNVYVGSEATVEGMTQLGETVTTSGTAYVQYEYDLSEYAGETIYFAIQCTSLDAFYLFVDNLEFFGSNEEPLNDLDRALNVEGGSIHFENDATYPWTIETEGNREYAKSGNAGVASSTSTITATVTVDEDGIVQFDYKAWGEGSSDSYDWDKCRFAIDGNVQMDYGAHDNDWETIAYAITAGTHTLTWTYKKDGSVNPTGDYFAVDNVYVGEPVAVESITCTESLEVPVNRTAQIEWEVLPEAAFNKEVTITVDDTSIATVNENGVVTGVAEGETFVTIASVEDPSIYAVCEVTVVDTGLTMATIYAMCCYDLGGSYTDNWGTFSDVNPAVFTPLCTSPEAYAAAYAYGTVYGYTTNGDFFTAPVDNLQNMTTFAGMYTANTMTSMTFDYTRGCLFGVATGDNDDLLVAIDPSSGTVTEIGAFNVHPFGLCVDEEGTGYGVDQNGTLYTIDLDTAAMTAVGSTGVTCGYVQDICYDFNSGDIYWGQILDADNASLYRINKATGSAEDLGMVGGSGMELVGMFIIPDEEPQPADDVPVESITITPEEADVRVGETVQFTALVRPFNASNKNVEWEIEDENIAVVDQNGLVMGVAVGTTMVFATTEDGDFTAYAIVNVLPSMGENVAGFFFETDPAAEGWTFVDQDGDGNNWIWANDGQFNTYEGMGMIYSQSYINYVGALTPDNWAISPAIEAPAGFVTVSLYAVGQDPSYAAEHFAIYAGTSPDPASMTQISDEYVAGGEYAQYTGTLADFEGGTLYVAVRHFNVTDMFYLNVDQVEVFVNSGDTPPTPPPTQPVWGDADGDGDVDSVDVLLVMRYVQGIGEIDEENLPWVDVNGDGEVTMADALLILRKTMNIIEQFPVEIED